MKLATKLSPKATQKLTQKQSAILTFIAIASALLLAAFLLMTVQHNALEARKCRPTDTKNNLKSLSCGYFAPQDYPKHELQTLNFLDEIYLLSGSDFRM